LKENPFSLSFNAIRCGLISGDSLGLSSTPKSQILMCTCKFKSLAILIIPLYFVLRCSIPPDDLIIEPVEKSSPSPGLYITVDSSHIDTVIIIQSLNYAKL